MLKAKKIFSTLQYTLLFSLSADILTLVKYQNAFNRTYLYEHFKPQLQP